LVGIETIRIHSVFPCWFAPAVCTLQPSGQSRIDPHADAEPRDREKAAPIGVGSLAVSFCAVQRDQWRGAKPSVLRVAIEASRSAVS
jgi:hypothetical protein